MSSLKTFEMAIIRLRRMTRTESLDLFVLTLKNIFLALLRGGGGDRPPYGSATDTSMSVAESMSHGSLLEAIYHVTAPGCMARQWVLRRETQR